MSEQWINCARFPLYEVSDAGNIRNKNTKRILKTSYIGGYEYVCLRDNNCSKTVRLHRIIAESFYGLSDKDIEVNHIDGNKKNNRIDNLEFCTRKDNIEHAMRLGLFKPNNFGHASKHVYCRETDTTYKSIRECSRKLNIDQSELTKFLSGKLNYTPSVLTDLHFEFVE